VFYDVQETGVTFVGAPIEVVRTTDTKYLDQARSDFVDYVHKTLAASQANGGRYNPPGEFSGRCTPHALSAAAPTPGERNACHEVGRRVRVIADFLQAPSARATGANVPLFPDREGSTLRYALAAAREARPPDHFLQTSRETW